MMVSDKMVYSLMNEITMDVMVSAPIAAQAVVNAAWHEFDPDDVVGLELDRDYLIMHYHGISDARFEDWDGELCFRNDEGLRFSNITYYADPQDLMFKGEK